jgi:sugar phosphate isomerase/epimerase
MLVPSAVTRATNTVANKVVTMLRVGLNPYGLSYTVGLQGAARPINRPEPIGMAGFIALAREMGATCIELDARWLMPMADGELTRLGEELAASGMTPICSDWLTQEPGETLAGPIRCASAIGASLLRIHLTPVLEGARARWGARWGEMVAHARATLKTEARRADDAGLVLAVENHQDLTSEELITIADETGGHVGLVLDTGNPFAVGEDPLEFMRRAAHRVRHVHLKDYVAQFTDEGYRLIRCAIGDGCVPLSELADMLPQGVTASIEPGALEARHIRLFARDWWHGYPPREASELGTALGRLHQRRLAEDADWRTPWETLADGASIVSYEMAQIRRSVDNLRALGLVGNS